MKRCCILITMCLLVLLQPAQSAIAATANQIAQYGITWTFDKEYEYGQFANGDYWVVGPLNIVAIDPVAACAESTGRNGTMINPRYITGQGYDGRAAVYTVSVCHTPVISVNPGDTVVSSVSLDEFTGKSYIKAMAVLTVVDKAQSADKFRPPVCRPTRIADSDNDPLIFSANSIRWDFLERLEVPNGYAEGMAALENTFERYRMEHFVGYRNHETNQVENTSTYNYGRNIASDVSAATMRLLLDYPVEQKRTLMLRLLQYGIDIYGVYLDGGSWSADGGIFCGRKWTLLFTGIMLDNEIKDITMNPERFHEDGQSFYVEDAEIYEKPYVLNMTSDWQTGAIGYVNIVSGSKDVEGVGTQWLKSGVGGIKAGYWFGIQDDVEAYKTDGKAYLVEAVIDDTHLTLTEAYRGQTNTSGTAYYKSGNQFVWYGHGSSSKTTDYLEYEEAHRGLPEWGIKHFSRPVDDGLDWDAAYRRCCNANAYAGFVLAAHIMEEKTKARTLWGYKPFFDFQDRYMEVEYSLGTAGTWMRQWNTLSEKMWDTYRKDYGCYWARDNQSDTYSTGHYVCGSAEVRCSELNSCNDYPNEIAREYNPCNFVAQQEAADYGDIFEDDEINAYDAAICAQAAVGLISLGKEQTQKADVSGDSEVSAYDAALIAQYSVGIIGKFPVEG